MSDGPSLGVFFTPSPSEVPWRDALIATATAAGWRVIDGASEDAAVAGRIPGTLRFATCDADIAATPGVDWLVIHDSPSAALAAILLATGCVVTAPASSSAIWHTAQRFATASTLALGGARVQDGTAGSLDLPDLGRVHRADTPAVPPVAATALNIYQTVPPALGATAIWAADLFTYPAGRAEDGPLQIDLTGRPRVLVYGPHIDLPAGNWRATARIGADPEGGRVTLRLEWGSGAAMTTTSVRIEAPGHYAIHLEQSWLGQGPAEIRIWLEEASFGGRLTLLDVAVERL